MISRRARSAIAAMLDVARLARGKPLPAKALATRDGLASRQFETVLQDLVRAGLLRSLRGPHGGYELARERRRISLGDIVRAVGEMREPGGPGDAGDPAVEAAIAAAAAAFMERLDGVTVADLLRDAAAAGQSAASDFHI